MKLQWGINLLIYMPVLKFYGGNQFMDRNPGLQNTLFRLIRHNETVTCFSVIVSSPDIAYCVTEPDYNIPAEITCRMNGLMLLNNAVEHNGMENC